MSEVKKAELVSMNVSEDKLRQLRLVLPEVFTEAIKVDIDKLKLVLGENIEVGKERFEMNWPGKADCFKTIQAPSVATLIPVKDESVNFDTTENLFIEGDNLEVLKLLQKSYYGKVKMIYIDPPYNTGSDFIYPDNYAESLDTYLKYSGQLDEEGRKYSTNADTDGRFHSKWLNMMYPRIYLAKNLMKNGGVIFISIGDREVANLKKLCDEIFGEENFVGLIPRCTKRGGNAGKFFSPSVDYLVSYARNEEKTDPFRVEVSKAILQTFKEKDDRGNFKWRNWYDASLTLERSRNARYKIIAPDGSEIWPPDGQRWRNVESTFLQKFNNGDIGFRQQESQHVNDKGQPSGWAVFYKLRPENAIEEGNVPDNLIDDCLNSEGTRTLSDLGIQFDFSKPVSLIKKLMQFCNVETSEIVLDFFAGSCTTAHAVLELNKVDGGGRKFICVQLPEITSDSSEAKKAGLNTIADIGKMRIRNAIQNIREASVGQLDFKPGKSDDGFKVFKLTQSNFKVWEGTLDHNKDAVEKQLEMNVDHINPKSSQEDILFELLLKAGFELTTKIEKVQMEGKIVYSIESGLMLICLEKELTKEVIKAMADKLPSRVICLDQGFAGNDQLKTNAVQIMKSKGVEDFRTV